MTMERNERLLAVGLRLGLVVLFIWMVKSLLVPIGMGGLFALLLYPIERWLEAKLGRHKGKAPALITIGAFVLIVIPFALIAAKVVVSINDFLSSDLTQSLTSIQTFAQRNLAWLGERFHFDASAVWPEIGRVVQRIGTGVASVAGAFATALPGQIIDVFLFALALYYFLRDGKRFLRFILRLLPFQDHDIDELFSSINETVRGAILGQLATSGVQGALTLVALYIFNVPGAFLFGIIATLLSVIPMVGTTPVTVGATIYLFAKGSTGAAIGMAIGAVIIGLSDNVVRPWMQSARTTMHPLLIVLGIFGGLEAFGAAGVFLGPVVAAIAVWTVATYPMLKQRMSITSMPPSAPPSASPPTTPSPPA